MNRLALAVAVTAAFSVACTKDQPLQPPTTGGPAFLISDGTHNGGNPDFFFLPPLVPDPSGSPNFNAATFNSKLSPVVEVCRLQDNPLSVPSTDCLLDAQGHPVLVFGPAPMPLDGDQYLLNWDTKAPALDLSKFYRIRVRGVSRGRVLGFLDVNPVDKGMKNLKSGDVVQFQDGRTLPIKVRIQEGAFGSRNPDHVEQVVPNHITTPTGTLDVTTTAGFAGARFPDGWLPSGFDQVVVIIERIPVNDGSQGTSCLQSGLVELEGCYRFRTDPDLNPLELRFSKPVISGVCFEMPIHTSAPYQLHRREEDAGGTPFGTTVPLEDADAPFLTCDKFASTPPPLTLRDLRAGHFLKFASAGWSALARAIGRLVTPEALHAVDLGAGGSTDGFSRFGYARAGTMTKTTGDNQTAIIGTRLPVDPKVCLTTAHPRLANLVADPVTFTVTAGAGTVGGGPSQIVATGADGCAQAAWVLGSSTTPGGQSLSVSAAVSNSPLTFTATGLVLVSLDAGDRQSCSVGSNGKAYCWGSNLFGQLGNGGTSDANVPTLVSGGLALASISSTLGHSCAFGSDGLVSCWGRNDVGQLGDATTANRTTPVAVSGGFLFQKVSTGGLHTCALTPTGAAYCWGDNRFGQLGGSTVETCTDPFGPAPCSTAPVAVSGQLTFKAISAGFFHTCGLRDDGAAFCWGRGILGNLGTGTRTSAAAPVPVTGGLTFASLTAGAEYTCGLATGGVAYCWGVNSGGQLGLGPTNLGGVSVPTPVSGELSFVYLSAANENNIFGHTCGIAVGGAAYCWGGDLAGEIGAPTSETCPGFGGDAPHPCATSPLPVSGGLLFRAIAEGIDHTCAIAVSGAAYCWGGNNRGQLGNGTTTASSTPVLVSNPATASP